MLTSVKGICRNGRVELTEYPADVRDETQVIVTFVETGEIDIRTRGIGAAEAAELREKSGKFRFLKSTEDLQS